MDSAEICKQCIYSCHFVFVWCRVWVVLWQCLQHFYEVFKCVVHDGRNGQREAPTRVCLCLCECMCVWECVSESEGEEQCYWEHFVLRAPMWNSLRLHLGARANLRSAQCSDSCITAYFSHSGCNVECDWLSKSTDIQKAELTVCNKKPPTFFHLDSFCLLYWHDRVLFTRDELHPLLDSGQMSLESTIHNSKERGAK